MLLLNPQITVFLFFSRFLCLLLRFGFVIIAPRIILIDHLLKNFNFAEKETPGSEKKTG